MLRNTLGQVIEMTREEARLSTNTSRGTDHLTHVTRVIKRHYEMKAEEWDWQHLELRGSDAGVIMAAGQRYYNFPVAVNINKITRAVHKWGNEWCPLSNGISNDEYSVYDSELDVRADPVLRWDFSGQAQFEVWPLPASISGEVRFEGQRKAEALVDNDSRLDLDDVLISLYAASTLLMEHDRENAAAEKSAAAVSRLAWCKAALSDRGRYVIGMGGRTGAASSHTPRLRPRHPTYIRG